MARSSCFVRTMRRPPADTPRPSRTNSKAITTGQSSNILDRYGMGYHGVQFPRRIALYSGAEIQLITGGCPFDGTSILAGKSQQNTQNHVAGRRQQTQKKLFVQGFPRSFCFYEQSG